MIFLVDYNLDGYAIVFPWDFSKTWLAGVTSDSVVTFKEAGLSMDSSDRVVWNYAQANPNDNPHS